MTEKTDNTTANDVLLDVQDLKTYFYTHEGEVRAVDGVSLKLKRGSILAVVGESGCGKSVTAYSILRLIQKPGKIVDGKVLFRPSGKEEVDLAALTEKDDRLFDILIHQDVSKKEAEQIAADMLSKVGIPNAEVRLKQYPHELSGGMRQRVVIAMALVCRPQLLIADEPTTALDVTIQAQIMKLMKGLQAELGTSVMLITHDLGVVAQIAEEVAVMYLGRIVEKGSVRQILKSPRHPYTQGLLASLPSLHVKNDTLPSIEGSVPSLTNMPSGCPFHPRCPHAEPGRCDVGGPPELVQLGVEVGEHEAACVRVEEIGEVAAGEVAT